MSRTGPKIAVEEWTSDDNQQEVHFFIAGKQNTYLFGVNPEIIPPNEIYRLRALCERILGDREPLSE